VDVSQHFIIVCIGKDVFGAGRSVAVDEEIAFSDYRPWPRGIEQAAKQNKRRFFKPIPGIYRIQDEGTAVAKR
jgi:hypothetical protein